MTIFCSIVKKAAGEWPRDRPCCPDGGHSVFNAFRRKWKRGGHRKQGTVRSILTNNYCDVNSSGGVECPFKSPNTAARCARENKNH